MATFKPMKNAFKKITKLVRRSFVNEDETDISVADQSTTNMSMLSQSTLKSRYEAESPDELALVKAVCNYGCRLLNRTNESVSIYLPADTGTVNFKVSPKSQVIVTL